MAWLESWVEEDGLLRVHVNIGILGDLSAQGVEEPRASVQLRELSLEEGDVLRTEDVLDALRDLQATQRYTTAYCELDRLHDRTVGLTFLLEPAPPVRLGLGLGYGTDWGSRYRASLIFEQPLPIIGEELRITAKYGENRQHYGIILRADRLAGSYAGWQGGVEYQRADVPRFGVEGDEIGTAFIGKTTGNITALFNLNTWGRLSAGGFLQHSEDMLDGSLRDNIYSGVELSGELDTEDRRPFPTSGIRIDADYTPYSTPFEGERNFSIFDMRIRGTAPIFPRWVGQLEVRGGIAESTTPSSHRFAIGGLESIPAFSPYRFLALRRVCLSATARYDLISRLVADAYLLFRYDMSAFGDDRDWRPTRDDIVRSYSVAFALDTRLGPLEIWSAWAPASDANEYAQRVAVNFGYRF